MISAEETRKNIIDSVVNNLVAQKKLLAKNESLPGECYDEAMVHFRISFSSSDGTVVHNFVG
jgi:hypothetical protein